MKRIDITGKKFNCLTVIGYERTEKRFALWKCKCDCGNEVVVRGSNLKSGAVKSCGCLKKKPHNDTHGQSHTKLYARWKAMHYRCEKENNRAYKWYGARGIKVCEEWSTFENFKEWAERTCPGESYTIERVDVNGNYSPDNCIWLTRSEQTNNRRTCQYFEYNGETKNLSQWCNQFGIDYKLAHNRIYKLGWTFEKAMTFPVDIRKRNKRKKNE